MSWISRGRGAATFLQNSNIASKLQSLNNAVKPATAMPTRSWPTSEQARTTRSDCRRDLPTGFVCRRGLLPSDCENEAQPSSAPQPEQEDRQLGGSPGSSRRAPACDHLALAGNPKPR